MSAPQAAAITACTACAAVGGAAAGGAFSSGTSTEDHIHDESEGDLGKVVSESDKSTTTPPTYTFQVQDATAITGSDTLIGKKYQNYLIGVYGSTTKSNEEYWKLIYEKYKTDTAGENPDNNLSDEFKTTAVSSPFESSTTTNTKKGLNKACEAVYKKEHSATLGKTAQNKDKYKKDLWKYCSELGEAPKTVSEAQEDSAYSSGTPIGKSKKDTLLALSGTNNEKLWEWKNNEFKSKDANSVNGSVYFQKALEKAKLETPTTTLKKACEEAYKKTSASGTESETEVKDSNVVKFCSLDGAEA